MASEQEDLALLIQETMEDLKEQRMQNVELLRQNKILMDQLTQFISTQSTQPLPKQRHKVEVTLQTRNRVHSIYASFKDRGEGWDFTSKFTTAGNQGFVGKIIKEIQSTHSTTTEEEITEACSVYFKSLKDDDNRHKKGIHSHHRRSLKLTRRIKQKLHRRKKVLEEAAGHYHWSNTHKERVKSLLKEEYMSSETSADESDTEDVTSAYAFKVRKLQWLKKRYRKAFKELDEFGRTKLSKRSRGMTKPRVPSSHRSRRPVPADIPIWAKAAENTHEEIIACSTPLETSTSSIGTE